jgi:putative Ig domain-containing protein/galactose oxidase-like protein
MQRRVVCCRDHTRSLSAFNTAREAVIRAIAARNGRRHGEEDRRRLPGLFVVSVTIAVLSGCLDSGNSGPPPLTITAAAPPSGTTGLTYAGYTFTASGGTPPLNWSESGGLPPGLMLGADGQLSGVPAIAGDYPDTVTVTDSSVPPFKASVQFGIKIIDSTIVIAPASPPAGTVTYVYPGFGFSAGGGSPPYTWKASGTVPPGLTFGSDGTMSGTPTQVGTFPFSVTATDSAQTPASSAPLATQIVIGTPPTLTLNASPAPPAGVDGTPYGPFSFSATGGYLPLHWSVTAGSLPPGLTLGNDGSLSGTPTSFGTFMFTVTVTDSAPAPVSQSLPFTINVTLPPPPVINNQEAPTGTVGVMYTPYTYTASNGVPPLVWSEAPPLTIGVTLTAQGVLTGTPTAAGQFPITLNAMDAISRPAPSFPTIVRVSLARPPASFTATAGSMAHSRSGHAATLLLSGQVLVTGGGGGVADPTAELYDPGTGLFTSTTGNMTEARIGHSATLLNLSNPAAANYGKVLIVGSVDATAELYDPGSGTFAATGSMHHPRTSPTATLLNTGKVLVVGGNTTSGDLVAELYDPSAMTFSDTGSTTVLRSGHTATLLADGHVLVAGGGTATAELYDPAAGTFTATAGNMTESRTGHTATLLEAADGAEDGYVLILGSDGSAELYDPSTQMFERVGSLPSPLGFSGTRNTASLRNDGTVLAAGGATVRVCSGIVPFSVPGAALFAPESNGFTATGLLNTPRDTHTATVLKDGTVLVAGGTHHYSQRTFVSCIHHAVVLSSAELFK